MSSLWGSKKIDNANGDQHDDEEQGEQRDFDAGSSRPRSRTSRTSRNMREPTERDRLLPANPRPPHSDGYLDPDDPAVSIGTVWY